MLDPTLQRKPEEQYPLLKIDGGGDMGHVQPPQTVVPPHGWGVTCTKKYPFSRWPEFISACWMTLILCGISFLILQALGMGFYRRQQLVIMKCNTSKPASNVYYHSIIHRGSKIPFVQYTEYLANMATQYPLLHFNVLFLIDDYDPKDTRISRQLTHSRPMLNKYKLGEILIGVDAYTEFQKRYQNVNVTIISLSEYMAMTPLKFKWRLIPQAHLAFYARVFSVWQNGGIGIDLRTFNNEYYTQRLSDPRIDTILKQHNAGINIADYRNALSKIDNDEANAVFSMFSGLINNILKETRAIFNRSLSLPANPNENSTLIRTHRSKRQTSNATRNEVEASKDTKHFYNIDANISNLIPKNSTKDKGQTEVSINATTESEHKSINSTAMTNTTRVINGNDSEVHQVIWLYDIILSDTGPSLPHVFLNKPSADSKKPSHLLSIDAHGTFIAATSRLHPFLAHLISAGCFGINPKFAIQDAILTQCSGVLRDDVYCNNIYIL